MGGFRYTGRTKLVLMDRGITGANYAHLHVNTVYAEVIVLVGSTAEGFFQEDNALPLTAWVALAARVELDFRSLRWMPQSPDLNPIENDGDILERKVRALPPPVGYWRRPALCPFKALGSIPQSCFCPLVDSMPRRMQTLTKTKGYPMKR